MDSKQEEGADPHESNMLPDPPRVIVQRILCTHTQIYMLPSAYKHEAYTMWSRRQGPQYTFNFTAFYDRISTSIIKVGCTLYTSCQCLSCVYYYYSIIVPRTEKSVGDQSLCCWIVSLSGTTYLSTNMTLNLPSRSSAGCWRRNCFVVDHGTQWLLLLDHRINVLIT